MLAREFIVVKILIVCSGNTCRSPMAAGLLRMLGSDRGLNVDVCTAGLAHHPGRRVAEHAVAVMREWGQDISADYSKPVTEADVGWADLILAVAHCHADDLADQFPSVASKVRALEEDVDDPYCQPIYRYRECRNRLRDLLARVVDELQSG